MEAQYDVIAYGAGVVGCSVAVALGKQGRRVLLLERSLEEPNRIVGELMQPGGVESLRKLGLLGCLDGIDSPCSHGYVVFKQDGSSVRLQYPPDPVAGANPVARTFHHGRFIMRLREAARAAAPAVTLREGTVKRLIEDEATGRVVGVQYVHKSDGGVVTCEARAPLTIVCDGCNSDFRRQMVPSKPYATSRFVGLILKTDLPFPNYGHVVLADPSPVLLYPISSTEVRVLVDVPMDPDTGRIPSAANGELAKHLLEHTAPQLPAALRSAFSKQVERIRDDPHNPNSFPSMANSSLHPDPFVRPGTVLLGDSFNMRHPLTGGGMSVALNDVLCLTEALASVPDLADAAAVAAATESYYRRRYALAATVNTLASALYGVFASSGPTMGPLRDACFRYFELGGLCVAHPMRMLGAMLPSPTTLCVHFYAVATVGVGQVVFQRSWIPWPSNIVNAARMMWRACQILVPVLAREGVLSLWTPRPRRLAGPVAVAAVN